MTTTTYGSAVVAACEKAWLTLQEKNPGVPNVVIILGDGRGKIRGHFHPNSWHNRADSVHEVLIAGQRLADGPEGVLSTLIHEGVHAYCQANKIKETSRQSRYHNKKFANLARDFGLTIDAADPTIGWSNTRLSAGTSYDYAEAFECLKDAIDLYKRSPMTLDGPEGGEEGGEPKASAKAICGCVPERELTISRKKLEEGPIICGLCEISFTHNHGENL